MIDAKIRIWLEELEERAKQSGKEYSTPEVVTGYYAADKVMDVWKISNGRTWWDDPVLVQEFHEYADGTVHAGYYVEGVQTFSRQEVENSGLQAIRPADLGDLLPVSRVVYTDHSGGTTGGGPCVSPMTCGRWRGDWTEKVRASCSKGLRMISASRACP